MKTYIARRGLSGTIVLVRDERGERALTHHVKHSPTGFEWGYGGSGPAELARCILIDHFDQPCQACGATGRDEDGYYCIECRGEKFIHPTPREYQGFKEAVIGVAPHEGFEITTAEVDEIVTGSAA